LATFTVAATGEISNVGYTVSFVIEWEGNSLAIFTLTTGPDAFVGGPADDTVKLER
jgi:hypothetical protein